MHLQVENPINIHNDLINIFINCIFMHTFHKTRLPSSSMGKLKEIIVFEV